jgi:hypothetical protein
MVAISKQISNKFEAEERLLGKLYDSMEVGKTVEWMSIKKAIELFDEKEGTLASALIVFDDLGILGRNITYPDFQKQNVAWTLLVPRKEAEKLLADWHEKVRMSPTYLKFPKHEPKTRASRKNGVEAEVPTEPTREQVAVATRPATEGQELVASAGPEAPNPFTALRAMRKDESKAVIEAARQYANKGAFLEKKIAELREEGFEVAEGALSIKRDDRLEAVALAVPYVEALERENERLLNQASSGRTAIRELEDLRNNYARLKRSHENLIAQRASGATVASGR